MSQKTALQKMIVFTEMQISELKAIEHTNIHAPAILTLLNQQLNALQSLLQYEQECIEGAYKEGVEDVEIKNNKLHYFISAQDYFTSTYNNPQGGGGE